MPLPFAVEDVTRVEQQYQSLYVKNDADGKFYLQVEGVVAREKLDEFRNNNIELMRKMEVFKDVDPAKYKKLVEMEAQGKFNGKTPAEVDQLIQERVGTMRTEYEEKITSLTNDNGKLSSSLSTLLVDNVIREAAGKAGVAGAALDDVLLRGKSTFKLVDGIATPHDSQGRIIYGKDGTTPMSPAEWVSNLKKDAPHLFPQSQGGGAPGSRVGGVPNGANLSPNQKIAAGLQARR